MKQGKCIPKINKQPNDSIFLTHVIWSKTNLGMQHIHLDYYETLLMQLQGKTSIFQE
jgi:hypothetical protein